MLRVDTTRSPTLIQAVLLKRTPLGLMRNTLPLAFSAPCIFDISLLTTRLRTADVADGCSKVTLLSTPMEKSLPVDHHVLRCLVYGHVGFCLVYGAASGRDVAAGGEGGGGEGYGREGKEKEMVRNNIDLALFFVSTHVRPMSKTCPALTNCIPIPTSTLQY